MVAATELSLLPKYHVSTVGAVTAREHLGPEKQKATCACWKSSRQGRKRAGDQLPNHVDGDKLRIFAHTHWHMGGTGVRETGAPTLLTTGKKGRAKPNIYDFENRRKRKAWLLSDRRRSRDIRRAEDDFKLQEKMTLRNKETAERRKRFKGRKGNLVLAYGTQGGGGRRRSGGVGERGARSPEARKTAPPLRPFSDSAATEVGRSESQEADWEPAETQTHILRTF